ncbi:programmed cell death protein 2 [Pisolithus marmoratus]|nr:programmed cell death protein 2 [Pisolithus marmoratus]
MPTRAEDEDWSDSDDEAISGAETDVLLGVPDGRVESENDLRDAAVSRIGGLPVRALLPSREPPFPSSQCDNCSNPTELLVQIWCPFENSPMDRALYIWGCARASCQRQPGSVRAWRALRYNADYAAKLEKKKARKDAQRKAASPPPANDANPFSMQASAAPSPFGLGDQIFGQAPSNPFGPSPAVEVDEDDDQSDDESKTSSTEDSLVTAMASTTIQDSPWTAAPSYPPTYLSTMSEYIPPAPKAKIPQNTRIEDSADDDSGGKGSSWGLEAYENTLKVDLVFERFTKRISHTADQCLRYDLKGTPLPFASDKVFEVLFPAPPQDPLPVTGAAFKVVAPVKRSYNTSSIPHCSICKSNRVFECQLMPNLINILRAATKDKGVDDRTLTDAERIKAVQDSLKSNQTADRRGMEWGTCMVFSCEKDCCLDVGGKDAKECWREEHVLVQWDE